MKIWKIFTGAVLVLAGFCAGTLLDIHPFAAIVHGAAGDPQPALKTVAHNATLAGDGTTTTPLGIANAGVGTAQLANGGVSAPKLSTSATPSPGQILGFNGNLAWQNAPVGGVRVVDSLGNAMGPFFPPGGFLRQVGPFLFEIAVSHSGFGVLPPGTTLEMDHTTTDCSGTRYYVGSESPDEFIKSGNSLGTQLIYHAAPPQLLTVNSYEDAPLPLDPNHIGTCHRLNPEIRYESLPAIFDLSTLGFTPPFHLEF